jgi:dihydrofolate reductase
MAEPKISIVVAVAENGVIGRENGLPWKLSTDLKRFKALTSGKPVVLGRKTFESFGGKPLPGRPHVIVTRRSDYHPDGVDVADSLEAAVARAKAIAAETGVDEICVIGGGEIYAQALPLADILHITHVEAAVEGDTHFPPIDDKSFERVESTAVPVGERDSHATRYEIYRRLTLS